MPWPDHFSAARRRPEPRAPRIERKQGQQQAGAPTSRLSFSLPPCRLSFSLPSCRLPYSLLPRLLSFPLLPRLLFFSLPPRRLSCEEAAWGPKETPRSPVPPHAASPGGVVGCRGPRGGGGAWSGSRLSYLRCRYTLRRSITKGHGSLPPPVRRIQSMCCTPRPLIARPPRPHAPPRYELPTPRLPLHDPHALHTLPPASTRPARPRPPDTPPNIGLPAQAAAAGLRDHTRLWRATSAGARRRRRI